MSWWWGQSAPGNWNNHAEIIIRVSNNVFRSKVLDQGFTMPKGSPNSLAVSDRDILRRWVEQGAKNN